MRPHHKEHHTRFEHFSRSALQHSSVIFIWLTVLMELLASHRARGCRWSALRIPRLISRRSRRAKPRRGGDSNPRRGDYRRNGFRDRRIQPLCHLSATECIYSPPALQLPLPLPIRDKIPRTLDLALSVKHTAGSAPISAPSLETRSPPDSKKP